MNSKKTSWDKVHSWYGSLVGKEGHFYHKEVIFPKLLPLLRLTPQDYLLDIACGQGVLSRVIPQDIPYVGFDISKALVAQAQKQASKNCTFYCFDAMTLPWRLKQTKPFTRATCILALQNKKSPETLFKGVHSVLASGGLFAVVLNHPCFRIPRQSKWGYDEPTKTQTRELFSYMTPQEIPILAHPGKKESETTWSFHFPLSHYSQVAEKHGFSIIRMEEWVSPKKSEGSAKVREDRARKEFPLFLFMLFKKE